MQPKENWGIAYENWSLNVASYLVLVSGIWQNLSSIVQISEHVRICQSCIIMLNMTNNWDRSFVWRLCTGNNIKIVKEIRFLFLYVEFILNGPLRFLIGMGSPQPAFLL